MHVISLQGSNDFSRCASIPVISFHVVTTLVVMFQQASFHFLLGEVLYQPEDFTGIGVTPGLEFGIY